MGQYTGLYVLLGIIFILVTFNRNFFWWVKVTIVVYYSIISYIFITIKNKIDKEYENITPVPDSYWDENSGWVYTMIDYYFWPLSLLLLFMYYKWFKSVQGKTTRLLVLLSMVPAAVVFLFFMFIFGFSYGYRP